ncbi:GLIPR1-like protein 1 isoform X2 [Electrophorus electricus]|uniref:GLIPR1-like protein 1 isoform X2 n=1 Tax=Electrophorus electricus TaxID=8005 RepID=UPI0015D005B8|nr:GLIPR1-like protein 1 isoform X2 [Electrophorus electricus]
MGWLTWRGTEQSQDATIWSYTMCNWRHSLSFLILLLSSPALRMTKDLFPDIVDKAFIEECLREHNAGRSRVSPPASNMLYMTWDEGLAVTARAWARKCLFEHNIYLHEKGKVHPVFTTVGENIWAGAPYTMFSVKKAIEDWINENLHYDYDNHHCKEVCTHYTLYGQRHTRLVVLCRPVPVEWQKQHSCPHQEPFLSATMHQRKGNYPHAPYLNGESCSRCGNEKCDNKLCHNITREEPRRYKWNPDWDPALPLFGSFYKTILIIRPLSLVFIFSCVYCLQRHYTNLFAYTA